MAKLKRRWREEACAGRGRLEAQCRTVCRSLWRTVASVLVPVLVPVLALALLAGGSAQANIVGQGNVLPETGLEQLAGGAISMPVAAAAQAMGATISGDAWGGNLASASNQILIMERIDQACLQLGSRLDACANAVTLKLEGHGAGLGQELKGVLQDLQRSLQASTAAILAGMVHQDHDFTQTQADCTEAAVGAAGTHRASFAQASRTQRQALIAGSLGHRDGASASFAEAAGRAASTLFNSQALQGGLSFKGDWLLPASDLTPASLEPGATVMAAFLANPHPLPRVSERMKKTAAGQRAQVECAIKSAQSAVAEAALLEAHAPFEASGWSEAVPLLERESGVAEQDRMASDGGLYSRMQYLQARAGWFTSLPMKQNVERMGRAQLLRELVHLLGEIYSLEVDRYRAELHRTAALGALLGIMTEGQNQKASEFFTQLRQERQE